MHFLFKKNYLDVTIMGTLKNNENPNEEKEPIAGGDDSHNESVTSGGQCESSGEVSTPPHSRSESEVLSRYVSSSSDICHGLNHIEDLKVHTFMEILYHSNSTSVLPMISWNLQLWNTFHDTPIHLHTTSNLDSADIVDTAELADPLSYPNSKKGYWIKDIGILFLFFFGDALNENNFLCIFALSCFGLFWNEEKKKQKNALFCVVSVAFCFILIYGTLNRLFFSRSFFFFKNIHFFSCWFKGVYIIDIKHAQTIPKTHDNCDFKHIKKKKSIHSKYVKRRPTTMKNCNKKKK
ncbi:hypothetical protein RFI_15907 [Reticulomyxa filosa]|uniref:Uncharacterized protein n=1 Tax=Reticulomyxa filosa TaxID=46433 RepID=X6N5K8_RETFI|nr:hypothetical protein RFI_15907 [Reticulomyxa filosa]|eukprot:ETO21296.1 hypothetical protein RFI_15907 [Reticulomyxa filosa]